MCWKHLPHLIESKVLLIIRCTTNIRIHKKKNMLPSKSSLSFTFQPQVNQLNTSKILYTSNSIEGSVSDALSQPKWARTSPQNSPCLETSLPSIKKISEFSNQEPWLGFSKEETRQKGLHLPVGERGERVETAFCLILTLAIDGLHLS